MKNFYPLSESIAACVQWCRDTGNLRPSHCDVRCMINDDRESRRHDGARVSPHYSQDRAYREVLRSLRHG
jgi:hypothetical protein